MILTYLIAHITQLLSIGLAFLWFGWKLGTVIFLLAWSLNASLLMIRKMK